MELKELRKKAKMTQARAAAYVGVSLRTYKTYENDVTKKGTLKYRYIVQELKEFVYVDETHGILEYDEIVQMCKAVFDEYPITFCYLFGSYAKGKATEKSDVDLLLSSEVKGLKFYGLVERIKNQLNKNVDVVTSEQLKDNLELLEEILKEGKKIYG
ncbi:MAG: nucleotidyltransferase domain-containing protein [Faecalimonas sp.]|nr:nucleotidyltransferase domain-containing protein [Faecalimonas sp.]